MTGKDLFSSCRLYFFPHSFSSSYFLPLFHCLISFCRSLVQVFLGKYSCMSSPFSIAILNGTWFLQAPILFCGNVPAVKPQMYKQTIKYYNANSVIYYTIMQTELLENMKRLVAPLWRDRTVFVFDESLKIVCCDCNHCTYVIVLFVTRVIWMSFVDYLIFKMRLLAISFRFSLMTFVLTII